MVAILYSNFGILFNPKLLEELTISDVSFCVKEIVLKDNISLDKYGIGIYIKPMNISETCLESIKQLIKKYNYEFSIVSIFDGTVIESLKERGELDTFKRTACLLVAINRGRLSKDKRINASIALDATYKMCEKPYWNVGENFDVPKKLEEVDFKKAFENDMNAYNKSKEMLIDSLVFENGSPLSYNLNLELFYQVALGLKHNPIKKISREIEKKYLKKNCFLQK